MDNALDPLIGRDYELERVVQILCRRTKNNPVLIGEPGVGKTAIVEGLAQRIAEGRRALFPGRQAHPRAGSFADRGGHQVSRPVRGAAQDHHEGADGKPERHHLHRRAAHAGGGRFGRGVAGRRQHPEAGALARRNPVHRRHHTGRVPQIDREGPVARAPLPGGQGAAAQRSRRDQDPVRHQGPLREVPRRGLYRRCHRDGGLYFQPLHSRPLPAGQGHRPDRRSRRPRQAAADHPAGRPDRYPEAHQVHRAPHGERHRQPRVREGALLFRRGAQGAREHAPAPREIQPRRFLHRHASPRTTSRTWWRAGPACP